VVQRYDGTLDMSLTAMASWRSSELRFALEDPLRAAWRRWISGRGLAVEVEHRDGVDLQLRVGLNSGEVIAGDRLGPRVTGYRWQAVR
jgi:adenylate cyclase